MPSAYEREIGHDLTTMPKQKLVEIYVGNLDLNAPTPLDIWKTKEESYPLALRVVSQKLIAKLSEDENLLDYISANAYNHALNQLAKDYRHPEDIKPSEIVEEPERQRVEKVIFDLDDFLVNEIIPMKKEWNDKHGRNNKGRNFYFIYPSSSPKGGFVSVVNNGDDRIQCFVTRINPDDLDRTTDTFRFKRYDNGHIAYYSLTCNGESSPMTPWACMHKDDFPIINTIISRAETFLESAKAGARREISADGSIMVHV